MTRRSRRIAASAGLAVVGALLGGCAETGEPQQTAATVAVPVGAGGLTQTLVPQGDRFSRLTVLAATFGEADPTGVLRLEIAGAGATRTVLVDGADIEDNAAVPLVFPPIEEAAGRRFTATFSWEGEDRLALYAAPSDAYPGGALTPGGGDLAFAVGHAGRLDGALAAFGRVPGEVVGRFATAPVFTAVWLTALLAVAGAVGRSAWHARR